MGFVAKRYDKEQLLIDWRTGGFTQCDLAYKYKISQQRVAVLVKGIAQDLSDIIVKKIEVEQALAEKSSKEVVAIDKNVQFKLGLIKQIELFSDKALTKAADLLEISESGVDFKAIVDGVDKLTITNKINDRHAKPSIVQTNIQNNFEGMSDDDLVRELKQLERYGDTIAN